MLSSGRNWRGRLAGAVALLLGLLAPAPARAACGDHVLWGPPSARLPLLSPEAPRPCTGPECSEQPSPQPAPAPFRVSVEQNRWAALAEPAPPETDGDPTIAEFSDRYCPDHPPLSIFHPPR
jgi:hypothetical protein